MRAWIGVLLLAASLAGCSSFQSRWDALAAQPAAPAPTATGSGLLGRWEGNWHSTGSGHEGALRCIIDPAPVKGADVQPPASKGGAGRYLFRFSARWGLGFVSEYELEMDVIESEGRLQFAGESDLGWFVGTYRCQGHIERDSLQSKYQASIDEGTFEMKRVK